MRFLGLVFCLLMASVVNAQEICTREREEETVRLIDALISSSSRMLGRDAIADAGLTEVYVHPTIWNTMDVEQKRLWTQVLSVWSNCVLRAEKNLGKNDWIHGVTMIDMMSGAKLATIGAFRGFRILS